MATRPKKTTKTTRKTARPDGPPLLEWLAAGCGLVAVLGAVGFLTWEGLQGDAASPAIEVRQTAVAPTAAGYVVTVEVENRSRTTAAAVEVEGALAARPEETVAITFDYVPGKGRREGAMVFSSDPRQVGLTLSVNGHVAP